MGAVFPLVGCAFTTVASGAGGLIPLPLPPRLCCPQRQAHAGWCVVQVGLGHL